LGVSILQSTLAASTLIISFVGMLKFSPQKINKNKNKILQINLKKENKDPFGLFKDILFLDIKSSRLINYSTGMC
jgi:hypothetical protein